MHLGPSYTHDYRVGITYLPGWQFANVIALYFYALESKIDLVLRNGFRPNVREHVRDVIGFADVDIVAA